MGIRSSRLSYTLVLGQLRLHAMLFQTEKNKQTMTQVLRKEWIKGTGTSLSCSGDLWSLCDH